MKFVSSDARVLSVFREAREDFGRWEAHYNALLVVIGVEAQEVTPVVALGLNGERHFIGLRSNIVRLEEHEMVPIEDRKGVFGPAPGSLTEVMWQAVGQPPSPITLLEGLGMPPSVQEGKRMISPGVDFSDDGESVAVEWPHELEFNYDESIWNRL